MKSERKPTTGIILEIRKPHKDGLYPVKLRVNYQRKRRYYVLQDEKKKNLSMAKDDFKKVMGKSPRDEHKEMRIHLNELERIAVEEVINNLPVFTFEAFEAMYFNKKTDKGDIFSSMAARSIDLRKENRISTAVTFDCALNSLKSFHKKEVFPFELLNVSFLKNYEDWMLKKGNSLATIGIYLRNVRAVYNQAKRDEIIKDVPYPFGEDRYQISGGKNIKKALSQADVGMIVNYPVVHGSAEQRYRDYWVFSYLCNGINVKDMARLMYRDIDGDVIKVNRAKTERKNRKNPRPITIVITRQIGRIIDHWGNKPALPDAYIFSILNHSMSSEQEYNRIQDVTKRINRYIKIIAEKLEIPGKVTTYTARHSFATVLKRSGASTEFISESLGHSNLSTTENYLADFEIDEKRKWQEIVGNFNNNKDEHE